MATVTKTKAGKYRFAFTFNYKQYTKTVSTKAEGYVWEESIKRYEPKECKLTFGEVLNDYAEKVSSKKKGERWEVLRIALFQRDELSEVKLSELSKRHLADWRDRRLKVVSVLTVLREWCLLSHCLQIAVNEWELITVNPMRGLAKPKAPPHRDRLATDAEIKQIAFHLNYLPDLPMRTVTSRVGASVMFVLETAFRAQEVANLKWADINDRVAKVTDSKTFAGVREVGLSKKAMAILKQLKGVDDELVFNLKPSQIDSNFRKCKANAGIEGLHYHDLRANAITQLSGKLDLLDLARMVGHKDLKMLQVYYRKSAKDNVHKLD